MLQPKRGLFLSNICFFRFLATIACYFIVCSAHEIFIYTTGFNSFLFIGSIHLNFAE